MQSNPGRWEVLDEEFVCDLPADATTEQKASRFLSGTFSFCYPGHESTIVILKVPGTTNDREAEWSIISPNSYYHPGRHDGSFVLPTLYPWKHPKIYWHSPILSAFVSGGLVSDLGGVTSDWHPVPKFTSFYVALHSLAAIVIFGCELDITTDPTAPIRDCRFHKLRPEVYPNNDDGDWRMRVTNFFSRVYNHFDDDDNPEPFADRTEGSDVYRHITDFDRLTSVNAIEDFQKHILKRSSSVLAGRNPKVAFQDVTTLRGLLREERVWADALNNASSRPATQMWGKAETFQEHSQRLLLV